MQRLGIKQAAAPQAVDVESHQRKGKAPGKQPGTVHSARFTKASGLNGVLQLRSPRTLIGTSATWTPLARTGSGTVAARLSYGSGQVILIGAPSPLLNGEIEESSNLNFLLSLLATGPVYWDEYVVGQKRSGTIFDMLERFGLLPVLFQLAFVLGLYVWSTRGKPRRELASPARARSSSEQIETLAHLYSRMKKRADIQHWLREEVQLRLSHAFGCSVPRLKKRLDSLDSEAAGRAKEILASCQRLPSIRKQQAFDSEVFSLLTQTHTLIKEKCHGQ
jgi:hypothetical protein